MATREEKIIKGLEKSLSQQMRAYPDEDRQDMLVFIRLRLPRYIKSFLDPEYTGIFGGSGATYYSDLRRGIASNAVAKRIDDDSGNRYSIALKYLSEFVGSKFYPRPKLKVDRPRPKSNPTLPPSSAEEAYVEGATVQTTVDRRERNPVARRAAIARDGYVCRVCGFDFEHTYGKVGREYIEVHHLKPISSFDDEHEVNPEHLVCLCANCHAMAHRRRPEPFSIDELKELLSHQL